MLDVSNLMKTLIIIINIFVIYFLSPIFAFGYEIAFNKNGYVYVFDSVKTEVLKTDLKSYDFCFSPDGKKICAVQDTSTNDKIGKRYLIIYDIKTKQIVELKISRNQCFGPMWSSSGRYILFMYLHNDSDWKPAIYDVIDDKLKILNLPGYYICSWVNSNSFLVHDDKNVKRIDINSNILEEWHFGKENSYIADDPAIDLDSILFASGQNIYYDIINKSLYSVSPVSISSKCVEEGGGDWFQSILEITAGTKKITRISTDQLILDSAFPSKNFDRFIVVARNNKCKRGIYEIERQKWKKILDLDGLELNISVIKFD